MYDVIYEIIGHEWVSTSSYNTTQQQYIYFGCICLICILTAVFIDLIYRVFRHFWR